VAIHRPWNIKAPAVQPSTLAVQPLATCSSRIASAGAAWAVFVLALYPAPPGCLPETTPLPAAAAVGTSGLSWPLATTVSRAAAAAAGDGALLM
jgi:hypothetical protein